MTIEILPIEINQGIVTILGRKLYRSNLGFVIVRELVQNSLDAESSKIEIEYIDHSLIVKDNGTGIKEFKGLMNSIGTPLKNLENPDVIGGFALGKLVIFCCKKWKFISLGGSFCTGFAFDNEETIKTGCIVECQLYENDTDWNFESMVKGFLSQIERKNLEIFYNGEKINQPDYTCIQFGTIEEKTLQCSKNGNVIVRVNGMPTFEQWIRNLNTTIFFDYHVSMSPYDEGYPLSANRDSFVESSDEYKNFKSRIQAIEEKIEKDSELAETIHKENTITKWRNKEYFSLGDIKKSDYDQNTMLIYTYERYISQISNLMWRDVTGCHFGLTDGSNDEMATYNPSLNAFRIKKGIEEKAEILTVSIHEFVHFMGYGLNGHDQSFAYKMGVVTESVLNAMFENKFRK